MRKNILIALVITTIVLICILANRTSGFIAENTARIISGVVFAM